MCSAVKCFYLHKKQLQINLIQIELCCTHNNEIIGCKGFDTEVAFWIIDTNTWAAKTIEVPIHDCLLHYTMKSDPHLLVYNNYRSDIGMLDHTTRVSRLPMRCVNFNCFTTFFASSCFRKPDSLVAIAWGALRTRREFDAEYYEAALRKLPPNFETRSWLKNNV